VLTILALAGLSAYIMARWIVLPVPMDPWDSTAARVLALAVLAALTALAVWARFVEPRMLRTTRLDLATGRLGAPLRAVFLSDIHAEGEHAVHRELAARVRRIRDDGGLDAILLGGDYLNDTRLGSVAAIERFLRGLGGLAPVYAVLGNADLRRPLVRDVLVSAGVRVLENEVVDLGPGAAVWGIGWLDRDGIAKAAAELDRRRFNVCLTHAPGIVPEAAAAGFDLYLCGHTHGGQVRLPLVGALVTLAVYGKRWEAGRYAEGGMTAYVTRGVGLEGGPVTRARLLCPPEIVLVEVASA